MRTIRDNTKSEIIIRNSRFICYLYKVNDVGDIDKILCNIKNVHKDATHYCYAYVIDNVKKSSDDGEPSGTAGIPILNVLVNNDLNKILAVVVRYFGGIKLGAGGLIRAYSKSVSTTISDNNISDLVKGYNIYISFSYNQVKKIDYLLRDFRIIKKEFDTNIRYNLDIPKDFIDVLEVNKIDYVIIKDVYLEV